MYPNLFQGKLYGEPGEGRLEYWSKGRVMDTLDDTRDYRRGATAAWPVLVGLSVWVGTIL